MVNDNRKSIDLEKIGAIINEILQTKGFVTQEDVKTLISNLVVSKEEINSLIAEAVIGKEAITSLITENETFKYQETPPTAANATGTKGTISWDSSFLYLCVNTNAWVKIALTAW